MQERLEPLVGAWPELSAIELRLAETFAVVIFLIVARWLLLHLVRQRTTDARTRYNWRRATTYVLFTVGIFLVARVWFVGVRSVATFLGIVAAGLVIALKEPLLNIAAWFFLLSRRPFVVGDRIQIGSHIGDVIDERLLEFSLLEVGNWVGADQSTGRVIHVPNARVFVEPVANYTRGFPYVWDELTVAITFESDWRTAKRILREIVELHAVTHDPADEARVLAESGRFLIFYSTLQPAVYTTVNERGVALTARYICEVRRRRDTAQAIWEDVLDAFAAAGGVDFAYPTRRVFSRDTESRTLRGGPGEDA